MYINLLLQYLDYIPRTLSFFARAGGGGSDSDGDGGDIFAAIGYGIGYAVSKPLKKFLPYKIARTVSLIIILIISLGIISITLVAGSFVVGYILVLIIIGLWIGWYQVMFDIWQKLNKKFKKADQDIALAAQTDTIWDESKMHKRATEIFFMYQDDWTRLDASRLKSYMSDKLSTKTFYFYQIFRSMNRQNAVINPEIIKIDSYEITDNSNNESDSFTVIIEAKADDMLINLSNNQTIFVDKSNFIEYWKFIRSGNDWFLDDITQNTAKLNLKSPEIINFANSNNLYYSNDMGWLFLPEKGQVFSKGKLGVSDINNHAMGYINDILTQLYTYSSGSKNDLTYTIGQINIPKQYGQILIKPKPKFFSISNVDDVKPPSDSVLYDFEWQDFNHKFEVWATDQDRLASFELVNPKFMETIYGIDEKIVLEVVGNIVYFRSSLSTNAQTYNQLMEVLKQAYKELKL